MRRTIALFGAAALAVVGLASPANASEISAITDIEFSDSTGISNGTELTGVTPDPTSPHNEAFYDFENIGAAPQSLDGLNVDACVGPDSDPRSINLVTFMDGSYASTHVVPTTGVFSTADPNFSGSANVRWNGAPSEALWSTTFQLELYVVSTDQLIDATSNNAAALHPDCVAQLPSNR